MKSRSLQVLLLAVAGIALLFGLYFSAVSVSYLADYLSPSAGQIDGELLGGALLALFIAWPFWLLVSILTYPLRGRFGKGLLVALNTPAVSIFALLILVTGFQIASALLEAS